VSRPETQPEANRSAERTASLVEKGRAVVRSLAIATGIGFVSLVFFFLLEGAASTALVARAVWQRQEDVNITEERHTRFDAELGWVSIPNTSLPDFYGPGKHLTTNDRGFRGSARIDSRIPEGRERLICSGDSFTLGHGVGDADTWCAQLAALEPSLETVNMGQGGYGIDQAFLWYAAEASDLDRSAHVFAFIGDDFFRMQRDHFLGFSKPVLSLVGGVLHVENTPVSSRNAVTRWLVQNGNLFAELASVRVLGGLAGHLARDGSAGVPSVEATWQLAEAVFDSLASDNARRGAQLLLVFLPTPWDYDTELYARWRRLAGEYATRENRAFLDLVIELRALSPSEAASLFIPEGQIGAPHFNEAGNAWAATHILDRLKVLRATSPTHLTR